MNTPASSEELHVSQGNGWKFSDEELQTLYRMAVYGSLTRKFIHEINNSLTGIIGYNSLALRNATLSEKEKDYINRSLSFCQTAKTINDIFLNLFPSSRHPQRVVSLEHLLVDLAATVKIISDHKCSLSHEIDPRLEIRVLPEKGIREILLYLIIHILDQYSENTAIHVLAEPNGFGKTGEAASALSLRFSVTGPAARPVEKPASPETLFFKADGGLNDKLALSLAQTLLGFLGGTIEAPLTAQGGPSHFHCQIPVDPSNGITTAEALTEPAAADESFPLPPLKILLLEDQDLICGFIQSFLQEEGHQVLVYQDGETLWNALPGLDLASFHIFLLDVFVPSVSGTEVAGRIRALDPEAAILFYSALADLDSIADQFPPNSRTFFLRKPFQKSELFSILRKIVL